TNESMAAYKVPLAVLSAAICYGIVVWHIPSVAASAISGTVGFGPGEVIASTFLAARMMPTGTAAAVAKHGAGAMRNGGGGGGGWQRSRGAVPCGRGDHGRTGAERRAARAQAGRTEPYAGCRGAALGAASTG